MQKRKLERETLHVITAYELLRPGDSVLAGVSGGPDSMALLHILAALRGVLQFQLNAMYVDHGLRPGETGAEMDLVRGTCAQLAVGCEVVAVGVRAHAASHKQSLEQAARELRYQAFREQCRRLGGAVIAVAHTADDQAEEILLKLLRGGGLRGLSGMRHKNGDIIRPLLDLNKATLLQYLKERGVSYCLDSSNADDTFLRNRVRNELLPFLEDRFDRGVKSALLKTASILADDEALLEELTGDAWRKTVRFEADAELPTAILRRAEFCRLPRSLQRRVVEDLLWRLGSRAGYAYIMRVMEAAEKGTTGSELHLKQGLRVGVEREYLRFSHPRGRCSWRGRLRDVEQGGP